MPDSTNVQGEIRRLAEERLDEIDSERKSLEKVIAGLDGGKPRKRPGRPRGTATPAPQPTKRRRRKGKTRADEAVALVNKRPGISASDIAKVMKIKPNYLYRVLGDLEKEKRVKKDGRNYFPVTPSN
jgi:DNA invertase Pin-like site-specific DNA recombinase